ncbi:MULTISPECIES: ubiquinone biosynthesis accessory factor UbiJ [Shewanella]|uniref:ubiquinone biosynthesis accessory factor UbiJ n=1 Tax=Shewanella TaxID=22 RepID=UPI0001E110FC|nr:MULTISPECIES: SCP2 sterol-binding domain-containing protein [Shewanella]AEG09807.1 Sterol-binding domain protein [Shewanella baltica BA175]EHQ16677.1 Sterol-binding domain protein [Shewanella baltica OS183]MCS6128692.1 sterol-binding protein [Shewanella baltica]MCS6140623.1 sterol-binding protein [Shewanella baltica]MCS6146906.1 sterol-binding protein [Shewanella baltica]
MMPQEVVLLVCAAIETGLKKLQAQAGDDYSRQRQLHGKVFRIQLSQLSWPLYLVFAKEIQVLSRYEGDVDVSLHADATTLYRVSEGANLTELIKQDKLKLEGDLNLLQSFSQYLRGIEFDFAEPISRYLGDGPTHKLISTGHQAKGFALEVLRKTRSHLGQLAVEEYRLAPHPIELLHFRDQMDDLVADTRAIEQRIAQLRDQIKP